jgi:hypothetical protein
MGDAPAPARSGRAWIVVVAGLLVLSPVLAEIGHRLLAKGNQCQAIFCWSMDTSLVGEEVTRSRYTREERSRRPVYACAEHQNSLGGPRAEGNAMGLGVAAAVVLLLAFGWWRYAKSQGATPPDA